MNPQHLNALIVLRVSVSLTEAGKINAVGDVARARDYIIANRAGIINELILVDIAALFGCEPAHLFGVEFSAGRLQSQMKLVKGLPYFTALNAEVQEAVKAVIASVRGGSMGGGEKTAPSDAGAGMQACAPVEDMQAEDMQAEDIQPAWVTERVPDTVAQQAQDSGDYWMAPPMTAEEFTDWQRREGYNPPFVRW
jgi:hypothetical protein